MDENEASEGDRNSSKRNATGAIEFSPSQLLSWNLDF